MSVMERWRERSLASCGTWKSGGTPSRANPAFWNGEVPWISAKSLRQFRVRTAEERVTQVGAQNGSNLVGPGTLLFVVRGMSLKSEFRLGVTERDVAFNQDLKALVPCEDVDAKFLGYALKVRESKILAMVDEAGHGTGRLSTDRIGSLQVALPTLGEQRRIAEALGNMDALIAAQEKLIAKKRAIKTASTQRLLSGKQRLPGFGEGCSYKQTELGMIPENWMVSTVGDEFLVQLGKMLDADKNVGEPRPYIGNRAVQWGKVDLDAVATMRISLDEEARFRLKNGDLLVCEGGEVGRAAIWTSPLSECYYQKALHRLRPKDAFSVPLMLQILQFWSSTGLLSDYTTQTSIAHLTKEKFERVPLLVPPLREQQAIAQVLTDMDNEIAALEKRLAKTKDIKQGMMQELLTGRTRLV